MLDLMRKHAGSWVIKVILGLVILSFIIFYGYSNSELKSQTDIAKVNDVVISRQEFDDAFNNARKMYQEIYKERFTEQMLKELNLRDKVLDGLIEREILMEEAERLSLEVTDEEIQAKIRALPAFQKNGKFAMEQYQQFLRYSRMAPKDFEDKLRVEALMKKMEAMIVNTVKLSNQEEWQFFRAMEEKINLEILTFSAENFVSRVQADDAAAEKYFNSRKKDFMLPAEARVQYLAISPEHYLDKVNVTDEEVKEFFEANPDLFSSPETIHVRHILFKVAKEAKPEERSAKRAKMEALRKEIIAGKDFAALAKQFSEDGSAKNGGDLGSVTRGRLVKPFEDAAFALKPGMVSEVVSTEFGFHLIKVDDRQPVVKKSLEEARPEIIGRIKQEKAKDEIGSIARRIYRDALTGKTLEALAGAEGLAIQDSGFFTQEQGPAGIKDAANLSSACFGLTEKQVSAPIKVGESYYLCRLAEKRPAREAAYNEVRDRVLAAWKEVHAKELALQSAQAALVNYKANQPLSTIAASQGLKLETTGLITISGEYVPFIGNAEKIKGELFSLTPEKPRLSRYLEADGKYFLVALKERQPATVKDFQAKREQITKQLLSMRGQEMFKLWIDDAKSRGKIWRNDDLLKAYQ